MKKRIFLIRPHDCPERDQLPAEDIPLRRVVSETPEAPRPKFTQKTSSPPGPEDDENAARKIWLDAGHF